MFPKNRQIETGEFAIFTAKVIEHKEGDLPKTHHIYNTISLKGNVPHLREGDVFDIVYGDAETNKFGTSYTVKLVTKQINPNNKEELFEYFTIIGGKKIAKELIEYDEAYNWLMTRNNEELLKVKGIKEKKLLKIYDNIGVYADISYALVKLKPLGLTETQIKNICLSVGGSESAVDICMNNPYQLIDKVRGIGFTLADEIAIKCGLDFNSPLRLKNAMLHILKEAGENGKSYLTHTQLCNELKKLFCADLMEINTIVGQLIEEKLVSVSEDGGCIALVKYIDLEMEIAGELKRLLEAESCIEIPNNWKETVAQLEKAQGWEYTEEQKDGIEKTLRNNIVAITGKAGSGKSTITNAMNKILEDYSIVMCCLSAKASQRLREVTGQEACTIHKLLGIGTSEELLDEEKLYADIVIVDEASMVSGTLFLKLLKAIPDGAKLIILGDDGQLTAIGDCAVFADLLKSDIIPKVILTKIHRQAEKSAIITKSIDIRNQKPIYEKGFYGKKILGELQDLELYVERDSSNLINIIKEAFLEKLKKTKNILEVQVITSMKNRGQLSVANINKELQALYNSKLGASFKGYEFVNIYKGDKVINMKNNYSTTAPDGRTPRPVYNGSIGIVKEILEKSVIVDFVGIGEVEIKCENYSKINLAYAITVHSSQGSQWKNVICAFDMSSYILLNVEIAYTGISRAEEECTFIVEDNAMQQILRTVEQKTKQTLLSSFLQKF